MTQRDLFLCEPEPAPCDPQAATGERADPEQIRAHLMALLDTVRGAATMPWSERDARMWQIAFPQLTNWLPPDEAVRLRLAFAQEMQRLARGA